MKQRFFDDVLLLTTIKGSPLVLRSLMEAQAPAIAALGSLFCLTQVSLWYFSFYRCNYLYIFFLKLFLVLVDAKSLGFC